jgi:hypothetical protein
MVMSISGPSLDVANLVAVRVEKLAQDQAKQEAHQVVDLIEQAAPPIGLHGEGTHVNTYA